LTTDSKFAPMRSILLMNAMRGNAVLVGLTPHGLGLRLDAADRAEHPTAPSRTRSERSTSTGEVDVTGRVDDVDAMSPHIAVVAAEVMVMPRSCSWTIQSMVAVPSCTSPIL
jgi:hypothetical protein